MYKIFEIDTQVAKDRIVNDLNHNVDRSKVPMEIVDKMAENFIKAKERVLEEVKNMNVFLVEEKTR